MATKKLSPQESQDLNELKEYLGKIFSNYNISWVRIMSQLKTILKNNPSWNYSMIHYCLWYLHEIKETNIDINIPFALIPYVYDEARAYYIHQCNIEKAIKDFNYNDDTIIVNKTIKDDYDDIFD